MPIFIWWMPKGCCYDNQLNLGDIRRHHQERPLLFALAFDNALADREASFKRLNGNNPATSCTNFVNFCPIISEFTLLKRANLPRFGRNLTTIFVHNFDFRRVIGNYFKT